MKKTFLRFEHWIEVQVNKLGLGMRAKLIIIFLLAKVIPLLLVTFIAWRQIVTLGNVLREIAVSDSSAALNASAVENIERMSTDTALEVADFLYGRDADILYLAGIAPTEQNYRAYIQAKAGNLLDGGQWALNADQTAWAPIDPPAPIAKTTGGISSNKENDDQDGFHYRDPDAYRYKSVPLYDEITFVDVHGVEQVKVTAQGSTKTHYPMNPAKQDVSRRENTYVKAETYFAELQKLKPGEIYVSDVTGAYVGANYIGMYTPPVVAKAAADRGYDIPFSPEKQAYAGKENPNGQRFEGIVRWATPVTDISGNIIGYVTFALNHDHIMEFVDHITPMNERYTDLPSAFEGNYAFIWDYKCRSICHPRHHSIVGFDPNTGEPQIPWLETSIYEGWQASGIAKWTDYVKDLPTFHEQSRAKKPAGILTKSSLVGLDGRYLDNAPQCTGWMDLTRDGGSGSFYILWSGLYKLTTAAAIPYYTGHYAPSEENDFSRRGFGFVAIGAGLEDFTRPARETGERLNTAINENLGTTLLTLMLATALLVALVVLIAIWLASWLTGNITELIQGISRFRAGERQFRFHAKVKDEFGTLADSFDEMADSVVDSVKDSLCITNTDGDIIYINEKGLALNHKTLPEVVGQPYALHSVYPAYSVYDPILALQNGREADIYYFAREDRYVRGVANYFLNNQGQKIGYIIETRDVSDMVREQLKIEEQRMLLDKIFSSSPDLIWYMDMDGRYLAVNPRFASISGQRPEQFVGRVAIEMLPREIANGFDQNDREALAGRRALYTEERVVFADGHVEVLDSVRTPIKDANGALVGLLGYARNVNKRVTAEEALRQTQLDLEQAVADANRANEHKGDFLARMSHEIRTPMNAIIGITNIVQKKLQGTTSEANKAEVLGHVNQIETSSQHLLGLLNDILDISKIEAGKIELSEEAMELGKLANTVAGIIKPRCDEKGITFTTHFDTFRPSTFLSDSLRLRQVLINLLGNAVKFTPERGIIDFYIKKLDQRDGRTLVHFSVKDSGIGISKDAQANIFEPFEQGNRKVSRQFGGTGLGLAISRSIVQLFGGAIELNSELGAGSEFSFDIWLQEVESDEPSAPVPTDTTSKFTGKRLLLVDDVDINRMIVAEMLSSTGIAIDEANDGEEALRLFSQSPVGAYDIILMDVQMPVMDGYEASDAIRMLSRPDARTVPIIALTANAFKEDIDRALMHGMNAHVAKPVEMDTLLEILFRFLRK